MKFTAFVLAALPAAFAIPDGFVVKCCYKDTDGDYDYSDFLDTIQENLSGKGAMDICYETGCPDGLTQLSEQQLCDWGDAPDGVTEPAGDGFYCNRVDNGVREGNDIPWSCATAIRFQTIDGTPQSYAGAKGFYCGGTNACKFGGTVCGDPHIQTWSGEWFDFHGTCDLVFVKDEEFAKGLGLAIHLRTTGRYEYSFVETAAIQIGDDILQVSGFGDYILNGVNNAKLDGTQMGGLFRIEYEMVSKQTHTFNIIISEKEKTEKIQIKTFKDLVSVKFDNAYEASFGSSVGLMGNFHTGVKLARDGKTVIEDANEFGMEWQVRPEEPMLFQATRAPQLSAGEQCVMPSKTATAEGRRRLGEGVPLEAAIAACEAVDHIHHENCVYDVMATGDLEIVHAGVF